MIEALWSVAFSTPAGAVGTGVVVLETQRIFGGDSLYYYLGTYSVRDSEISGTVDAIHYAGPPWNIFGPIERLTLQFRGQITGDTMQAVGIDPTNQQRQLMMNFRRLAPLP